MGSSSPTVLRTDAAVVPAAGRRRPPTSQAERERRRQFGKTYGNIMRQIKLDRERSTE